MGKLPLWISLTLLVSSTLCHAQERRFACWGTAGPPVVSAQCPRNTVIQVIRAGLKVQTSGTRCEFSEDDCGCVYGETGCQMPDVQAMCMGKPACKLDVTQQYIVTDTCKGFSDYMYIEFQCVPETTDASHDVCELGTFEHTTGYLKTPNHPNPYPHGRHCECTLSSEQASSFQMQILDLELNDRDCEQDYVSLEYSGRQMMFCGQSNGLRDTVTMDTTQVLLTFHSDSQGADNGLWLKYSATPSGSIKVDCVSKLVEDTKELESNSLEYEDTSVLWSIENKEIPIFDEKNEIIVLKSNEMLKSETDIADGDLNLIIPDLSREIDISIEIEPNNDDKPVQPMQLVDTDLSKETNFEPEIITQPKEILLAGDDYINVLEPVPFQEIPPNSVEFTTLFQEQLPVESDNNDSNENKIYSNEAFENNMDNYVYNPATQQNGRRRISRLNLRRFRERMRQQRLRQMVFEQEIVNNDIDIPESNNEIDNAANERIENTRLDFEMFANNGAARRENVIEPIFVRSHFVPPRFRQAPISFERANEISAELNGNNIPREFLSETSSNVLDRNKVYLDPRGNDLDQNINDPDLSRPETTPWWWQYTAKRHRQEELFSSSPSPTDHWSKATLSLNTKLDNVEIKPTKKINRQGRIRGRSRGNPLTKVQSNSNEIDAKVRSKLPERDPKTRSNIQGNVLQNVKESRSYSDEQKEAHVRQQESATGMTVIAIGIIALIVIVIIAVIGVRWALNKREAKRAWRQRHRKECALRHHAARQSRRI